MKELFNYLNLVKGKTLFRKDGGECIFIDEKYKHKIVDNKLWVEVEILQNGHAFQYYQVQLMKNNFKVFKVKCLEHLDRHYKSKPEAKPIVMEKNDDDFDDFL